MEIYSRLHGEIMGARDRAEDLRREAAERRLVRQLRDAPPWRTGLAARLHALAERLELRPEAKERPL